jgi:hypothetical protein
MFEELCLLSRIEQIRLNGKKAGKVYPVSKGVMTASYQFDGVDYIIVHNRSDKAGIVELNLSGKKTLSDGFRKRRSGFSGKDHCSAAYDPDLFYR